MLVNGNENVMKALDLSTAHLTEEVAQRIEDGEFPRRASMKGEYGFLMSVPEYDEESGKFEGCDDLDDSFLKCLARAYALDCTYILFDRDAEIVEGLDVFDW